MPLPRGLARFNRVVTNQISKPFARHLPWFAVLRHHGRKSGHLYETPVNAWRDADRVVVALTYGDDVDWLKNTRAEKESVIVMGGREHRVGPPLSLSAEEGRRVMPRLVREMLGLLDVDQYVAFPILAE